MYANAHKQRRKKKREISWETGGRNLNSVTESSRQLVALRLQSTDCVCETKSDCVWKRERERERAKEGDVLLGAKVGEKRENEGT